MNSHGLLALALSLAPVVPAQEPDGACQTFWSGFRPAGVSSRVHAALTYDPPGPTPLGLYCAGEFLSTADGPAARIARWDGQLWTPLGAGISGPVLALAVHDDGSGSRLFAGGSFLSAGGVPAFFVAAWDGANWSPVGSGLSGNVHALCEYDDGAGPALYAAGDFTVPGDPIGARVARWDGTAWSVVAGGTNSIVWSLAVHDDGAGPKLYAAGSFSQAGSVNAQKIACFDGVEWSALGSGLNASAFAVASHGGELWVAGDFGLAGGVPVSFAARWNGTQFASAGQFNLPVRNLASLDLGAGPRLIAAGGFNLIGGVSATQIAQWDGAGWSPVGEISSTAWTYGALCAFDDGGGPVLHAGRVFGPNPGNVVKLDGGTWSSVGVDRTWSRRVQALATADDPATGRPALYVVSNVTSGPLDVASFASFDGYAWKRLADIEPNKEIETMEALDLGQGEELFIGGRFLGLGGAPALGVARWNGTQFEALGAGVGGTVRALCTYDHGAGPVLYAAGSLTGPGGVPTAPIVRWDGTSWSAVPGAPSANVYDLCVHDDGSGAKLYAAGGIFTLGGAASPPIARFDGTQWEPVGSPAEFGTNPFRYVGQLLSHDDGSGPALYAAGYFPVGAPPLTGRLIRWRSGAWSEFGAGGISDSATTVSALAEWDDGSGGGAELYIGGSFSNAGPRLVRWDGSALEAVQGGVGGGGFPQVRDLTVVPQPDGTSDLFVGGTFVWAGSSSNASANVARLQGCGPITTFCAGDGLDAHVTTPCPCSNPGGPGRGCAWSSGPSGARLATVGTRAPDTLVLQASGMPATAGATVFWKSDGLLSEGTPWGDGLRCIDGNLIRLGTKTNVAGAAQYPEGANAPISVRGQTPVGSGAVGYYQTSYRNAASFCTPFTYNTTNGVRVVW
ncbi:MAG: hypothetical protein IPJ77_11625 [Planctomycetes bacterium]|nr:hypothetical protein [Planctomycetota bacterium]